MTAKDSTKHSEKAFKLIKELSLEPIPTNYELFYKYSAKEIPELCKEIDELEKNKTVITDRITSRLHNKYIHETPSARESSITISNTIDRLMEMIAKLMEMVSNFSTESTEYSNNIGKKAAEISNKAKESESVELLLGEVVGQLKEIQNNSASFGIRINESQSEINNLRDDLKKATIEARNDGLTNLNNRRSFDEKIDEQTDKSLNEKSDLCLLLLDIDHFKKFNDDHGHQIGDEVLKVVAGVLRKTVRGQDIVARYGGEEFAILLPNTPAAGAHIVAENIRTIISKNRISRKGSTETIGQITVSIGVTRFRYNSDKETIDSFIKRADDALYEAKESGRNKVIAK